MWYLMFQSCQPAVGGNAAGRRTTNAPCRLTERYAWEGAVRMLQCGAGEGILAEAGGWLAPHP